MNHDKAYVLKALSRLSGILEGIAIDGHASDLEIIGLRDWLEMHEHLLQHQPFRDLHTMLYRSMEDGIIDEDERTEILEYCRAFENPLHVGRITIDIAVRELHGFLHGVAIDGYVSKTEIEQCRKWLDKYELFLNQWPLDAVASLADNILKDGKVTEDEQRTFLSFCQAFSEIPIDSPEIHDSYIEELMSVSAPILVPFTRLCDREHAIRFKGSTFCFTGPAKTGARKQLHAMVSALGGIPANSVIRDLDYLVIGAQSSPCWAFSTYGRKIEAVIDLQKRGGHTRMLHEDDFIRQAQR